jgi:hypothetical protein
MLETNATKSGLTTESQAIFERLSKGTEIVGRPIIGLSRSGEIKADQLDTLDCGYCGVPTGKCGECGVGEFFFHKNKKS